MRENLDGGDIPGNTPFTASATVTIVINALSAIGSITVPTTVPTFHFLAIQPSTKSVTPAYTKRDSAGT